MTSKAIFKAKKAKNDLFTGQWMTSEWPVNNQWTTSEWPVDGQWMASERPVNSYSLAFHLKAKNNLSLASHLPQVQKIHEYFS